MNDDPTFDDIRLRRLRNRALRTIGDRPVSDVVMRIKAIIGPGNMPDSEPQAQEALNKLQNGEVPTAEEVTALEIVIRLMRPVVFSRSGELEDLPELPEHELFSEDDKRKWAGFRTKVAPMLRSIGRIERISADGDTEHVGTGFLVSEMLLVTNRHVLGALTFGSEALREGSARVVFKHEAGENNSPADIVPITAVAGVHPKLDMALFSVDGGDRSGLDIDPTSPQEGSDVVTIGYPAEDKANNPLFLSNVFQGTYGVRRAALGEVLDGSDGPAFYHDCSTTQGNSGSPILSLETAKVLGIHRSGFFMYRNEAIDGEALAEFVR